MRLVSRFLGIAVLGIMTLVPAEAGADTFTFDGCLSNNWSGCGSDAFLGKLGVEVTNTVSGFVDFKFTNDYVKPDGTSPSITALYFDLGPSLFTSIDVQGQSAGVVFSAGNPTPPDVPAGNRADPDFVVSTIGPTMASITLGADTQGSPNGIDSPTEFVTLRFGLADGIAFGDIIDALEQGPGVDSLRIAAHIQNLPGGLSDSVICCAPVGTPTPEPAAISLFGLMALGAAYRLRRGKNVA